MNWHLFSIMGYLSVLLWVAMLPLWVMHFVRRPRRWFCHYALVIGVLALIFAKVNSVRYVGRIEVDRSEQIAEAQARQEAARKKAETARADDVAQIRFAEDDRTDFLDTAGLDEADRKYLESMTDTNIPAWKQEKKTRSATSAPDDSLDAQLESKPAAGGLNAAVVKEAAPLPSVLMKEKEKALADSLDSLNLNVIRWLLWLGIGIVVIDYLRRLNVAEEAYCPLPVPSGLVNAFSPLPPVGSRPARSGRSVAEELAWLARRGDAFVYLTGDPATAKTIPEQLPRLPRQGWPMEVLRVDGADATIDDEFVFEAVWFNRASFVIDSAARAQQFVTQAVAMLRRRRETRARVAQTVHLVWGMDHAMPPELRAELTRLARAAGWSVLEEK